MGIVLGIVSSVAAVVGTVASLAVPALETAFTIATTAVEVASGIYTAVNLLSSHDDAYSDAFADTPGGAEPKQHHGTTEGQEVPRQQTGRANLSAFRQIFPLKAIMSHA